jgi:hypothetical protein
VSDEHVTPPPHRVHSALLECLVSPRGTSCHRSQHELVRHARRALRPCRRAPLPLLASPRLLCRPLARSSLSKISSTRRRPHAAWRRRIRARSFARYRLRAQLYAVLLSVAQPCGPYLHSPPSSLLSLPALPVVRALSPSLWPAPACRDLHPLRRPTLACDVSDHVACNVPSSAPPHSGAAPAASCFFSM